MADKEPSVLGTVIDAAQQIIEDKLVKPQIAKMQGDEKPARRKDSGSSPEFCLFEDPNVYASYENDELVTRRRSSSLDSPRLPKAPVVGEIKTIPLQVGNLAGVRLPLGLTIVSGRTAVGKTDFFRHLSLIHPVERVLAVEPQDNPEDLLNLKFFTSSDAGLMYLVKQATSNPQLLPILDSLREPLFEINGPAGEKGIINAFFTALTRVSNTLALNGVSMLASVNPMIKDTEYVDAFMNKLSSAVPGYILLDTRSVVGQKVTFAGKIAIRPARQEQNFTMTVDKGQLSAPKSNGTPFVFEVKSYQDRISDSLTAQGRQLMNNLDITY